MREYTVNQLTKDLKCYSTRGRAAFYDQELLSYGSFSRTSSAVVWIKRKHEHKILKSFMSKSKFPHSQKRTKKYSSKYSGCRSVISIAQNFGHGQNKNLSLYTRQI